MLKYLHFFLLSANLYFLFLHSLALVPANTEQSHLEQEYLHTTAEMDFNKRNSAEN